MHVLALEPYAAQSHLRFLEGLQRHSAHRITIEALPARHWKWRMRTASLHFAQRLRERERPDVLLVSDYLNLAEFSALLPAAWRAVPAILYFHENQLTYPLREGEQRDVHFALTHLHSMLAAREVWFNSDYHRQTFRAALTDLVASIPQIDAAAIEATLDGRCRTEPLGIEVPGAAPRGACARPVVLWNHRLEYDKDPELLLAVVRAVSRTTEAHPTLPFRLRLLGQRFRNTPPALAALRAELGGSLEDLGFLESREDYEAALRTSDIVLSTARHEFFGLATAEALRSGCLPVLPDALAYPELLPEDAALRERFLYRSRAEDGVEERATHAAAALQRALRAARQGLWLEERARIAEHVARFDWARRGGAFDAGFERVAGTRRTREA